MKIQIIVACFSMLLGYSTAIECYKCWWNNHKPEYAGGGPCDTPVQGETEELYSFLGNCTYCKTVYSKSLKTNEGKFFSHIITTYLESNYFSGVCPFVFFKARYRYWGKFILPFL